MGVVKSEQDKGFVKVLMVVIFCVYSIATLCTSNEVESYHQLMHFYIQ